MFSISKGVNGSGRNQENGVEREKEMNHGQMAEQTPRARWLNSAPMINFVRFAKCRFPNSN